MVKVDLITGFLGSGKTTFIRKYVNWCISQGERICILENDYGAINVDTMLLSDLEGDNVGIEMVAGGCDYDCHIRRFKTKLITMAMLGYDRVIIEPSGVFDTDEFFDILHEEPLDSKYVIDNVIAIVKANLEENLSIDSLYMLAGQVANAGGIVLSHVQECTEDRIAKTTDIINKALDSIKSDRYIDTDVKGIKLISKDWSMFDDGDFRQIATLGYRMASFEKKIYMDDNDFEALFFMHIDMSLDEVKTKIMQLFEDKTVGNVIRVKGFVKTSDNPDHENWYEINANNEGIKTDEINKGQDVLIIIGENLNKDKIDTYFPSRYSSNRLE